jgi:hypothetical protein
VRKGESVALFRALQAHPGWLRTIAGSSRPLMRLQSLSEYLQVRRYRAHWLREPSSLFDTHVEMGLSLEVFAPHSPRQILLSGTILP